jgi:hypothetical protein
MIVCEIHFWFGVKMVRGNGVKYLVKQHYK